MSQVLDEALAAWVATGITQIGEIIISRQNSAFDLRHYGDRDRHDLALHTDPYDARALAQFDATGSYRPLKTAPNLRRGWRMLLADVAAVRQALDHFYPAMIGILFSYQRGELRPVPLRATLGRQSGMYAVTRKISDAQADALIGAFCQSRTGCLKTILWRIDTEMRITSLPPEKFDSGVNQAGTPARALPMLCHEACNLLVAEARKIVKATPQKP